MGKSANGHSKPTVRLRGKAASLTVKSKSRLVNAIPSRIVAIDSIAPHERNTEYHSHPEAQIEILAQSAQTFGQYKNVVVWKKQIIAGAGIWAGLKKAGATEIEIKDVSHLTQAQAFALMTADNETQKGAVTNDVELSALVREVLAADGEALARLAAGEQSALERLLADTPNFAPVGIDAQGRLDEKKKVVCPNCGSEFTT